MQNIKGQGLPWQGGQAHAQGLLPRLEPATGLPAQRERLDELLAVAAMQQLGAPATVQPLSQRAHLVDPAADDDEMPLSKRRPKVRERGSPDEEAGGTSERRVKKAKARRPATPDGPEQDGKSAEPARKPGRRPWGGAIAPHEPIPVDRGKPLEALLEEWVTARTDASPPPMSASSSSSSSLSPATPAAARWSAPQLADAIRRRVAHENPTFKLSLLDASLWRVLDLFGRLRGNDHERAVTALCTALCTHLPVAKRFGRMLVSHSEMLGEQHAPTIRLAVHHLGEAALFTPLPVDVERKAARRTHRAAQHGTLLDETIDLRPKLAGPVWRALFAALHERHDTPGIARIVETAVRGGGAGWQGLPVMFEALAAACGEGDMPAALLERCAAHLLQPPCLEIASDGTLSCSVPSTEALQVLLRGVSTGGWKPAHLQALRALWQMAAHPAVVRGRAEVLEPLLCDPLASPLALAERVREALEAAPGVPPDRLAARITGPLMAYLQRMGMTGADQRSLVDILCANLVPALDRLDAAQARAVLRDIADRLADRPDHALLCRLYEHLVRERVSAGLLAFVVDSQPRKPPAGVAGPAPGSTSPTSADPNLHGKALMRGAIAVEPPLAAEEAQALARLYAATIIVAPLSEQRNRSVLPQHLIRALAHRDPALPPTLWSAWVLGHAQGLAARADRAYRLTTLLQGIAVDAARITAACAEATGRAIALGLGGPGMPVATLRSLLDAVRANVASTPPSLSARLLRPLLCGLIDGLGGAVMPEALRAEVALAATAAGVARPQAAGPGPLEELAIVKSVLGGVVTPPAEPSSSITTTSPPPRAPVVPPRSSTPIRRLPAALGQQIESLVPSLFALVDGGAATAQPHAPLRELFAAAATDDQDDRPPVKLAEALARALLGAVRAHTAERPLQQRRLPPVRRLHEVAAWIGRTARSVRDSQQLGATALLRLPHVARIDAPGATSVTLGESTWELFSLALAAALEVERNPSALSSLVTAILAIRNGQRPSSSVPTLARSMAAGLRRHLQATDPTLRQRHEAVGILLDKAIDTLAKIGPAVDTLRGHYREVLAGLSSVRVAEAIPILVPAAAPMSLQRMALLMDLLASTSPTATPLAGILKPNDSELAILGTLTAVPGDAGTLPAVSDEQAFRLSLALALVNDRHLMQQRLGGAPSAPTFESLIGLAIPQQATLSPATLKRIGICMDAARHAHHPRKILEYRKLSPQARVDLLCEMYELPSRFAAPEPSQSLAALVSVPLPADLRLAGAARLVRRTASHLSPHHLFTARRVLTEELRAMASEVDAAPTAQQDQAQERLRQAITQVREVYEGLKGLPTLAPLFVTGPIHPEWVASHAEKLRSHLDDLEREAAEMRRAHQPAWVAQELLPIALEACEAVRRALAVGEAAGQPRG